MSERKRKILVVDDEAGMRHMLRLVLEKEGYEVIDAPDAETGLEILEKEEADVALCDIRMPGMDGLGFLREVVRVRLMYALCEGQAEFAEITLSFTAEVGHRLLLILGLFRLFPLLLDH